MLSFLLFSDLHLGAGEGVPVDNEKRLETLKRIVSLAREHDLLLIAGDLFDGNPSSEVVSAVADAFARLADDGVKILMTPGEHELDEKGKVPKFFSDLSLAALYCEPVTGGEFAFEKDGERIRVVGLPGISSMKLPLLSKRSGEDFTIGLFHGEVCLSGNSTETRAMILLKSEMMNSGVDFFALGHHHQFKLFKHNRRVIGAYAGSPEAVSFEEKGDRYALSFTISGGEISQIKRLTVNSITVDECTLFCSDFDSMSGLSAAIEQKKSEKKALKVTLRGMRNYSIKREELDQMRSGFYRLDIDDLSEPSLDAIIAQYEGEQTFRGDFIKLLASEYRAGKIPPGVSPDDISRVLWAFMKENTACREGEKC